MALARLAADVGVEAVQLYSLDMGHGNRPRPDELERYLCDVLDALDVPLVLSSHQAAGYAIPPELIDRLLDRYGSIVGVNCTNQDLTYLLRVLDAVDGRVDVHVGGPMHALSCLTLGGQGYLSSEGNLAPALCVAVVDAYARGDVRSCANAYARVMRLFAATQRLGGISAAKAALRALGLPGGWPRPPRLPVAEDDVGELVAMLHPYVLGSGTDT